MKVFHPYLSFGRYGCEVKKDVDVNHEKYKNSEKRILEQLYDSSPSTLQVIVALIVTAVIHFEALVTHSSPKSLYLIENVRNTRLIHSSPLITDFG